MSDYQYDELDLHHLNRTEALIKLDAFLNSSFLAGHTRVKIIHGKGKGILREAVWQSLNDHPLVDACYPAGDAEGGFGVTIVRLASGPPYLLLA